MNPDIHFFVPGRPVTKQRFDPGHRLPERVKAWEDMIRVHAKNAVQFHPQFEKLAGGVRCELIILLPDHRKRDIDNLSKAVLDGCNGTLWDDDTQVVDLHLIKGYDKENPGVHIRVWKAAEEDISED
jgi:Holliday junction resolvase RusA-like endonuclease